MRTAAGVLRAQKNSGTRRWVRTLRKDGMFFLMVLPGFLWLVIFRYLPMYGITIAFMDYVPGKAWFANDWVGLQWFREFFSSIYFGRTLKNTLLISLYSFFWGFPAPILFALMLNEVKDGVFKRTIQTISYFPHFISTVIICGMLVQFFSPVNGIFTDLIKQMTGRETNMLAEPEYFRTIYIASGIWQGFGWGSIVYLAAISGIDPTLYEAAMVDGAEWYHKITRITLPSIAPTIITLMILDIGGMLNVGFEKVFLLQSPANMVTSDVISTYTYRRGILGTSYGYGTAVGLFNSVANFVLLALANKISRTFTETALW